MFAQIITSLINTEIDRVFDYSVPIRLQNIICVGMRVIIPFGAGNRKTEGYVIALKDKTEINKDKIKEIIDLLDDKPVFNKDIIELALWMKEKYITTLSSALQTAMPPGIKSKTLKFYILLNERFENANNDELKILSLFEDKSTVLEYSEIKKILGSKTNELIKSLIQKKLIKQFEKVYKNDYVKKIKFAVLNNDIDETLINNILNDKRSHKKSKLIDALLENGKELRITELKNEYDISVSTINSLVKQGIVYIEERKEKIEIQNTDLSLSVPLIPTEEQKTALNFLEKEFSNLSKKPVLIHGVTSSGKTEIYLQLIEKVIKENKEAIILVPEIALTPMMVKRFKDRFGEKIAVCHSKLNNRERNETFLKAQNGVVSVVIGARSALFTPFKNLGVIIIDEEHESTYKSQTHPKYNTVETAEMRCKLNNALLVLGSATPSLESYYKALNNEYSLLKLNNRAKESNLPTVNVVDMRKELENGNRSIFSESLYNAIKLALKREEQIILFINRRAFSSFVSCRSCGHVMKCDNCNVSYKYHKYDNKLKCHYCGKETEVPKICPECGSKYIKYFGSGTQKIEEEVIKLFPDAKILRMDKDTTSRKNSIIQILDDFQKHKSDILIGTQMVAKGHDFPRVTVVGVMAADLSLNSGDYKGSENTFQLITQVAGRAGRDKLEGQVFVQTYSPDNFSIVSAANQNYEEFYEKEIKIRKLLEYPPFTNIISIIATSKSEEKLINGINYLSSIMQYYNKKAKFIILGPTPSVIDKIKNEYRWTIILKGKDEKRLINFVKYCVGKFCSDGKSNDVYLNITVNPDSFV